MLIDKELKIGNSSIPICGIGTYGLLKTDLDSALKKGFVLIDTAKAYANEEMIGSVIKDYSVDKIRVITKLFRPNCENKATLRQAVLDSTDKVGKVPDFFLIHGPYPDIPMIFLMKELEILKKEGLIKEWGVSNFDKEHLDFLLKHDIKPCLNQVEYHPFFQRPDLLKWCNDHNSILQAYRPIAQGKALENETIKKLAQECGVHVSNIIYAWLAQQKIALITKVDSEDHQKEYVESKELIFSSEQLTAIALLNQGEKGRTCVKGGWYLPFTQEIKRTWLTAL